MMFEMRERMWRIALVGMKPGVKKEHAIKELVRLGENVVDEFTARRFLRDMPKSVKVRNDNLSAIKELFETQEFFHHQRFLSFPGQPPTLERECWVTMSDPDGNPEMYFALASGLISRPPWDKVLREASIMLKDQVVITFDRRP